MNALAMDETTEIQAVPIKSDPQRFLINISTMAGFSK